MEASLAHNGLVTASQTVPPIGCSGPLAHPILSQHTKHLFAFTNAGKPIFSRHHDDHPVLYSLYGTLTVLLHIRQATREAAGASIVTTSPRPEVVSHHGGVVHAIRSQCRATGSAERAVHLCMHFMSVGEVRYVSVHRGLPADLPSDAACASQLQYAHRFILGVVPTVHDILQEHPGYDMRQLVSPADKDVLRRLLDAMDADISFLRDVVPSYGPPDCPRDWSLWLRSRLAAIDDGSCNGLFCSIFACSGRVVALHTHRGMVDLSARDVLLVLHLTTCLSQRQQGEAWAPICLPGFNSSGYVWCYVGQLAHLSREVDEQAERWGSYAEHPDESLLLVHLSVDADDFAPLSRSARRIVEHMGAVPVPGETGKPVRRSVLAAPLRSQTFLHALQSLTPKPSRWYAASASEGGGLDHALLSAAAVVTAPCAGLARGLRMLPRPIERPIHLREMETQQVDRALELLASHGCTTTARIPVSSPGYSLMAFLRTTTCAALVMRPVAPLVVQLCQFYYQPGTLLSQGVAVPKYNFKDLLCSVEERVAEVLLTFPPDLTLTSALGMAMHVVRAAAASE